jgi:hypothetical protein
MKPCPERKMRVQGKEEVLVFYNTKSNENQLIASVLE